MIEVAEENIAMDYKIGNTHVRIATDYCKDVTPEEVDKILDRIARIVQPVLVAKMIAKNEEKTETTENT